MLKKKHIIYLLEMNERWRFHWLKFNMAALTLVLLLFLQNLSLSCSLNDEGIEQEMYIPIFCMSVEFPCKLGIVCEEKNVIVFCMNVQEWHF